MNKIVSITTFLTLLSTSAFADWAEDFAVNAAGEGTDFAVAEALKAGAAPDQIMALVQQTGIVQVAPEGAIKALYCAGVSGPVVNAAAVSAGVPAAVVATGFQQSVRQCGPAGGLKPDPFSRTVETAVGPTTFRGQRPPGTPPGPPPGVPPEGRPPVVLPPVDGGGGGRPPSVSPPGFN
jgi:hypothetical protein